MNNAAISIIAILIIYGLSLLLLIPLTIGWYRHRSAPLDCKWMVSLGGIITLTVLVTAFICGLISYL